MSLRLITAPDDEMISREEAKSYARVATTDDDALIDQLITAARLHFEGPEGGYNKLWVQQTWELVLDRFPPAEIKIPLHPVQSIVSVEYDDVNGDQQTVSALDYYLDADSIPPWVVPVADVSWPTVLTAANSVRVRFLGGYVPGTQSESGVTNGGHNVPGTVKLAMKMLVAHWYDNRGVIGEQLQIGGGAALEVPFSVKQLMSRYRIYL